MAKRIFKNIAQFSDDFGKLFVVADKDVTALYNVYGLYTKNPDFDADDESEPEYKEVNGEQYLVDNGGRFIIENAIGNITWGETKEFFESGDGVTFTPYGEVTTLNQEAEVYIYWDGHNHTALTLKSDVTESEWQEVTDELGGDFEEKLQELADTGWSSGLREVLYTIDSALYVGHQSQFSGSLDMYQPITEQGFIDENYNWAVRLLEDADEQTVKAVFAEHLTPGFEATGNDALLALYYCGPQIVEGSLRFGAADEPNLTVHEVYSIYALCESPNNGDDSVKVFGTVGECMVDFYERMAELWGIEVDRLNQIADYDEEMRQQFANAEED